MAKLLAAFIGLVLLASNAVGVHVIFQYEGSNTDPQRLRVVFLYPLPGGLTNGDNSIISRDRITGITDANGAITISNLYGGLTLGNYRGELKGTFTTTTNWYTFPDTNGLVYAADYVTSPTNGVSIYGYSLAAGSNVTVDTNTTTHLWTVSATGGGGGGSSFIGIPNQFASNAANAVIIKSGSLQSNNTFYSTSGNITFKGSGGQNTLVLSPLNGAFFPLGMIASELTATNGAGTATIDGTGVDGNLTASNFVARAGGTNGGFFGDGWNITNYVAYLTNETHNLNFIGTNTVWVSGGGDSGVNGAYMLRDTVGGITVWTNAAGTFGIAYDPSLHVFGNESTITNSAGSVRYDNGTPFPPSGSWFPVGGTVPGPTVVVGTNTVSTNILAYWPLPTVAPLGTPICTNYYFVNPNFGNDTNGLPGRRDRPFQYLTNVLVTMAIHSNDVVFLETGTNYFGSFGIAVSNGVNVIGLGPRDKCWLQKDSSQSSSDVSIRPGDNCTLANFSGNLSTGNFSSTNVNLINLHLIGFVDCFLVSGGSSSVSDGCVFEVDGPDTGSGALIDAGVIANGNHIVKNSIFISNRRGDGATTRRGLAIKGGTNILIGCTFIAKDTTNNAANTYGCIGLEIQSGSNYLSGCAAYAFNTNANNAIGVSNIDGTTIASGPFSMVFAGGVASWISPTSIKEQGNTWFLGTSNWVSGTLHGAQISADAFTNGASGGGAIQVTDANKKLIDVTTSGMSSSTFLRGDLTWQSVGGGVQTPWAATEDAARFNLTNFGGFYSSNTLAASGAVYYQSNSGFMSLEYHGTNSPLKTSSANSIANGALGGSNIFVIESPGHVTDFAVRSNGNITIGNPSTATTVVNLGLAADGTVTTNASPVGSVAGAWNTTGNSGLATDGSAFLGNTDSKPFFLKSHNGVDPITELWISPPTSTYGPDIVFGGTTTTGTNTITSKSGFGGNFIAGGHQNTIQGAAEAGIFVGNGNTIQTNAGTSAIIASTSSLIHSNASRSAILGGDVNDLGFPGTGVTVLDTVVIGGINNSNQGNYSVVIGGSKNQVTADQSFAAGTQSKVTHAGTFSWSDSTIANFGDVGQDTFNVRSKAHFFSNSVSSGSWFVFTNGSLMGPFSIVSSNFAAIRNGVTQITNSGNFALFYQGTNPPAAGHENTIGSGVISSNWVFMVETPGHTRDFAINTNGGVELGQYLTVAGSGSNYFGANVNVNGTVNQLGGTNTGAWTSVGSNYTSQLTVGAELTPTNSSGTSFDFTKLVSLLTTNNAFVTTGLSGKDSTGKMMQWCTMAVTNSAGLGAAFVTNITFAANTHVIGPTTLNLTNWTELLCEYWPPNGPTNVFVTPCW